MSEHLGDRLSAYVDDELSPPERAAADQHLRECASCAGLLEELLAVDSAARTLTVTAPDGYFEAFPARVRERLAARRSRRIPAWTWAAAAALLLAVLTPLTLRVRPQAPPATASRVEPSPEESLRRMQAPAAASAAPPATTLAAAEEKRLGALGYVREAPLPMAKEHELRQKQDAALDDRLRERDADAGASAGGLGGAAAPGRRAADLKGGELKKEAGADRPADKLAANAAPAPASVPATAAPAAAAEPPPQTPAGDRQEAQLQLAARADQSAEGKGAYAAKPSPAEGALRATKAAGEPARTVTADEAGFLEEFEALASRPLRKAEEARTAARQWGELARRHPQAKAADEARVRAIEALATAWRLGRQDSDRVQARAQAQAYLAADGPRKDRVRAVLDQLAR